MMNIKKTGLIGLLIAAIGFYSCKQSNEHLVKLDGEAQGTSYHITYVDADQSNYQTGIDSILQLIDQSMSTYIPSSIISKINGNDTTVITDEFFEDVFKRSMEISKQTRGAFDATVGPLINAYGFGTSKKHFIDSKTIDSLKAFTGYNNVELVDHHIIKSHPETTIDFNAIAQGYSVDVLCDYLESKGISNYLVELGGEVKAKGSKYGALWKVGIDQPNEDETIGRAIKAIVELKDKALATSGNYRKFYVENGQKYAHIIDPRTGYMARQNILSSTVIANDCATADAYATSFMVMGLVASIAFIESHPQLGLEAFFIYDENGEWRTYVSDGLKQYLQEVK